MTILTIGPALMADFGARHFPCLERGSNILALCACHPEPNVILLPRERLATATTAFE